MAPKIIAPGRREDFFDNNGDPTLRFIRWIEDLTNDTNDSASDIEDNSGIGSLNAIVLGLQKQLGSGKPLTVDTTGFTVDTIFQSADETEA